MSNITLILLFYIFPGVIMWLAIRNSPPRPTLVDVFWVILPLINIIGLIIVTIIKLFDYLSKHGHKFVKAFFLLK